jgi:hypothetical protein
VRAVDCDCGRGRQSCWLVMVVDSKGGMKCLNLGVRGRGLRNYIPGLQGHNRASIGPDWIFTGEKREGWREDSGQLSVVNGQGIGNRETSE